MLKQINVVAIRYPLVPTLANAFLCSHEQIWLNEYPGYFKLLYDRKYIHTYLFGLVHLIILRSIKIS